MAEPPKKADLNIQSFFTFHDIACLSYNLMWQANISQFTKQQANSNQIDGQGLL